ncbi:MAG TPA: hypothetical protein VIV14_01430 [Gammaproteobacteria bacterium]
MNRGSRSALAAFTAVAVILLAPVFAWSQAPFPEGRARDAVFQACTPCHPLTRITDNDLDADEWEFTLYDMIARGAPLHEEDMEAVRQYLIDNFAVED